MQGLMMGMPLMISSLIKHADRYHGDVEIVSRTVESSCPGYNGTPERFHRYTYHDAHTRSRRLAKALIKLGVKASDRVGTLAWNGYRHFELYYAVSGMGAVIHTVNPRLFPEQIAWIVNDADDQYLCFDMNFVPLIEAIAPKCPGVKGWIILTDRAHIPENRIPNLLCYEDLVAAEDDAYEWPEFDEKTAAALCYTSGTTGNPKGVLYSHRSTLLHAYATCMPDVMGLSSRDAVLPVVPMFHVNAWGTPYSCALTGAKLVFPGAGLDGPSVYEMFENEGVTFSAGVPTVWLGLLQHVQKNGLKFSTLKRCVIGGSACPPALMKAFADDYGVTIHHGWGMTEMSPLGTYNTLKQKHLKQTADEQFAVKVKAGRTIFGVDLKIVDGEGKELPRDGKAFGDLLVRGPWIIDRYFKSETSPLRDGWFPTGDVATLDPDGYIQITDRSKDVIKSGGEWISSIDLENIAVGHPAVAEAAVIGVFHPKWDERPLLIIVKKPGKEVEKAELLRFYEGKIAKWWMPDDIAFVDEIPHTATGKILKTKLRETFKDYRLAG